MIDRQETFGQALRRLMDDRGVSLRELERRSQMSKSKLHEMRKPGATVRDEDAQALDEVLQSGITLATAARRDQQAALAGVLRGPNRYTDFAYALAGVEIASQGVRAVDRRQFLQSGVLVPALALELTRHGMGAALSARSEASAAEWEEIVHEHGYTYMTTAPHELLPPLMVDMLAIQCATPEDDESKDAQDLRRCGALLAALTAMTVANLGQLREGHRWWRTSRTLADKSEDPVVRAWVRGREIVRALYEQRPIELVLAMTRDYEEALHGAPKRALPEFLGGKAQALALAGRTTEAGACLPKFVEVCEALPSHVTDNGGSVFGWSPDRQQFTQSFVYSFSGDYERATEAQDAAVKLYPPSYVRGPAQIELQRAMCLARMGDSRGAAQHARSVLETLPSADHIRPIVDLAYRVDAAISDDDGALPEVGSYREYLSTTRQIEAT